MVGDGGRRAIENAGVLAKVLAAASRGRGAPAGGGRWWWARAERWPSWAIAGRDVRARLMYVAACCKHRLMLEQQFVPPVGVLEESPPQSLNTSAASKITLFLCRHGTAVNNRNDATGHAGL